MLTERFVETGIVAGRETGTVAGRELGGAHSGTPIVCNPRQTSKVGYAGGFEQHPASVNKMNTKICKRFIMANLLVDLPNRQMDVICYGGPVVSINLSRSATPNSCPSV